MRNVKILHASCILAALLTTGLALAQEPVAADLAAASLPASITSPGPADPAQEPMALGRDGTAAEVRTFTIEGEDRVSIRFDRPRVSLDLDPRSAPGLGWECSWDEVDPLPAVVGTSAMAQTPFAGRPWLDAFAQDDVVVFSPQAPEMSTWKLTVVDSRGKPAMVRQGTGAPPARLAWNGRRDDGQPAWPGLIYSFVLETVDPAGNPRTFSGRGFGLPAYRLAGPAEDVLVVAGGEIVVPETAAPRAGLAQSDLLLETASWLNQAPGGTAPIEIRATARTAPQARHLAETLASALQGKVCGAPGRVATVVNVVEDAPDQGVVEIASRSWN